eukprot:4170176-Prymnesium_polylepis.1
MRRPSRGGIRSCPACPGSLAPVAPMSSLLALCTAHTAPRPLEQRIADRVKPLLDSLAVNYNTSFSFGFTARDAH